MIFWYESDGDTWILNDILIWQQFFIKIKERMLNKHNFLLG